VMKNSKPVSKASRFYPAQSKSSRVAPRHL
jgi:hypothetical protein